MASSAASTTSTAASAAISAAITGALLQSLTEDSRKTGGVDLISHVMNRGKLLDSVQKLISAASKHRSTNEQEAVPRIRFWRNQIENLEKCKTPDEVDKMFKGLIREYAHDDADRNEAYAVNQTRLAFFAHASYTAFNLRHGKDLEMAVCDITEKTHNSDND